MALEVTELGPNSIKFSYEAGIDSQSKLFLEMYKQLIQRGWRLWDGVLETIEVLDIPTPEDSAFDPPMGIREADALTMLGSAWRKSITTAEGTTIEPIVMEQQGDAATVNFGSDRTGHVDVRVRYAVPVGASTQLTVKVNDQVEAVAIMEGTLPEPEPEPAPEPEEPVDDSTTDTGTPTEDTGTDTTESTPTEDTDTTTEDTSTDTSSDAPTDDSTPTDDGVQ